MSKSAIIRIDHRQYLVTEGREYTVPKFSVDVGKYEPEVLAVLDGENLVVGKPQTKEKVVIEVVEHGKGEKVTTRIYKAKSRYRKTTGHRKRTTKFVVKSIK